MYRAVDVLGFAGGFTLGAVQAGFTLVGKRELQGGFGVPNCEANRHLLGHGWRTEAGPAETWTHVRDVQFVFGNPPCSGFSVMTSSVHRGIDAKINSCMWSFVEYAARLRPEIIVMESVRQAFTTGRTMMRALRHRLEELTGCRYELYHVMQDALELGGAARRPRYFWTASRVPFGVEFPKVRTPILADAWDDLRGHALTWEVQPYRRPATWWSGRQRVDPAGFDGHQVRTSLPIRRALDLYELAGEWPAGMCIGDVARLTYQRHGRLPPTWEHMTPKLIANNFNMGFTQFVRWDPNRLGRVIIGGALDLVLHPWEPRTLTHREAARLMGFPDDWVIKPLRHVSGTHLTWGKGITVDCGRWVANWVRRALDGSPGANSGLTIGDREHMIISDERAGVARAALRDFANEVVCDPGMVAVQDLEILEGAYPA